MTVIPCLIGRRAFARLAWALCATTAAAIPANALALKRTPAESFPRSCAKKYLYSLATASDGALWIDCVGAPRDRLLRVIVLSVVIGGGASAGRPIAHLAWSA